MGSTCGASACVVALSGWADLAGTAPAPSSSHWGRDDTHPRQDRGPWVPRKGPVAQVLPLHHFPTASSCAAQACSTTAGRAPSITPPVPTAPISEGAGPCCPLGPLCPCKLLQGHSLWGHSLSPLHSTPHSARHPASSRAAGGCITPARPGMCVARLAWPQALRVFSWCLFHFPKVPAGPSWLLGAGLLLS